jgi:hypothetical protein
VTLFSGQSHNTCYRVLCQLHLASTCGSQVDGRDKLKMGRKTLLGRWLKPNSVDDALVFQYKKG